jgi:hypothetical protein
MSYSAYPAAMRFLLNSLNGFARNRTKTLVSYPNTAGPNDLVVVEIPAGCIVDMSTLTFHANLTTTATGGTGVISCCVPPKFSASMVQYLQVDVNGVTTYQCDNYNQLYNMYMKYMGGDAERNRMTLFEFGRNFTATPGSSNTQLTNVPYFIKGWIGSILGSGKYINTSITGPIRISMRFCPLGAFCNVGTTSYTVSNMEWHYDCIVCDDGFYNELLMRQLEAGPIQIPFKNYIGTMGAQQNLNNANNRFSVATGSLDAIWHTVLPVDYNIASSNNAILDTTSSTRYFFHGDSNIGNVQVQLGNTYYPQYRFNSAAEIASMTLDGLGIGNDTLGSLQESFKNSSNAASQSNISRFNFLNGYTNGNFLSYFRLNAGSSYDYGTVLKSGINTQGTNAYINVVTNTDPNTTGNPSVYPLTFAETTSTLAVGKYRQIQLNP